MNASDWCTDKEARSWLEQFGDANAAVEAYWASKENDGEDDNKDTIGSALRKQLPGMRQSAPIQTKSKQNKGIFGISSLHQQESDSDDEAHGQQDAPDLYAGGGQSGLAIRDPEAAKKTHRAAVEEILKSAQNNTQSEVSAPQTRRWGTGQSLGSSDSPSLVVSTGTNDVSDDELTVVHQHLTFWADGFSIEDGPLLNYEEHRELLEQLKAGYAPRELFKLQVGQKLDIHVAERLSENYVAPPKKPQAAFSGGGHRLGAPVPGDIVHRPAEPVATASALVVDETAPTTRVQVRMPDGTRSIVTLNHTHTVGDLRQHIICLHNLTNISINTQFPARELLEDSQTIAEAKLLNSAITVRNT